MAFPKSGHSDSGMTKECPDCREEKPYSDYGRNKALPDGLSFYCRECFQSRKAASPRYDY